MLRIIRIRGISRTGDGAFSFDYELREGLNLIASELNTRGKSSAILVIYYCLGFEEIVGGKGMKTLTSVYKTFIEDESGKRYDVLESEAWIEISNGTNIVTIMRAGKALGRDENLVTVYYSDMDSVYDSDVYVEDFYVHAQRSTTSSKGFHAFLEKFIGLELPMVPTNDGIEYKLYMQLLFSGVFIEQKRGWADLFSAMPIFNIKEAKKRAVEYLLDLDTLMNEKKKTILKFQESDICNKWSTIINEVYVMCNRENCQIRGLPSKPRIWTDEVNKQILITTVGQDSEPIISKLLALEKEHDQLSGLTPKISENYDQLQEELQKTENCISAFEENFIKQRHLLIAEKATLTKLEASLETIYGDLRNNKDALKLKEMGSEIGINSYKGICPVCHQAVEDSLLPVQANIPIMSIEGNISHLDSQKSMIIFALERHKNNKKMLEESMQVISEKIFKLRRLAKTLRSDLYSVDENLSETFVYKRVQLESEIQQLNLLKEYILKKIIGLRHLSEEWEKYLKEKAQLPKNKFSALDKIKISAFEKHFKNYLKTFCYSSVSNYDIIQISTDSYLPISEGFDMKFGSSASDSIRAIWAYTLALLRTSIENGGNHPQIIIFDEPAQHSMVNKDVMSLLHEIIDIPGDKQVILGITLNDGDIRKAVNNSELKDIHVVNVGNHVFQPLLDH